MEQARSEVGKRLDAELPASLRRRPDGSPEHVDPWDQECSFGRWAELFEARSGNDDWAYDAQVPEGNSWWLIGNDRIRHDVFVSTVWLGKNHQWGSGPPLVWETMIFGGPLDGEMDRYTTRAQAIAGHDQMIARARAAPTRWGRIKSAFRKKGL